MERIPFYRTRLGGTWSFSGLIPGLGSVVYEAIRQSEPLSQFVDWQYSRDTGVWGIGLWGGAWGITIFRHAHRVALVGLPSIPNLSSLSHSGMSHTWKVSFG